MPSIDGTVFFIFFRLLQRLEIYEKTPSKKKESEPSEWITGKYPGDKKHIIFKKVCHMFD